jgi:hypothetical protein
VSATLLAETASRRSTGLLEALRERSYPMRRLMVSMTAGAVMLAGCSADQSAKFDEGLAKFQAGAAKVEPVLARACASAVNLSLVAGLIPGVGAIVPYINEGCRTADGLAKLAANPTSLEWVGTLKGKIEALAHGAGMDLSKLKD